MQQSSRVVRRALQSVRNASTTTTATTAVAPAASTAPATVAPGKVPVLTPAEHANRGHMGAFPLRRPTPSRLDRMVLLGYVAEDILLTRAVYIHVCSHPCVEPI